MEIIIFLVVMGALLACVFVSIGIIVGREIDSKDDSNRSNGGHYINNTHIGKRNNDVGSNHK